MQFQEFLGFLTVLTVMTIGFWLMIFLISFVIPYWIVGYLREEFKLRREAKKKKANA
ncbi:MAG: hypothetical protein KDC69_08425 [Flavobacteriaceae bacterium]|nr:hypothetical protein [Flavobacteriaceae bacterium]MCB0475688.1 hypothetical protein [Flavobacteriaceae bacterium]